MRLEGDWQMSRLKVAVAAFGLAWLAAVPAHQLNGSHTLGDFGVQCGSQPQPGFYTALFYLPLQHRHHQAAATEILRPAPNTPGSIGMTAVAPIMWYMSKAKVLGANYGAMVVLPWANAALAAPAFTRRRDRGHQLRRRADSSRGPRLAQQGRRRHRRFPVLRAYGPVRTQGQREHRQGYVGLRAVRSARRPTSTRSGTVESRDERVLGDPRQEEGFRRPRRSTRSRSRAVSASRSSEARIRSRRGVLRPEEAHRQSGGQSSVAHRHQSRGRVSPTSTRSTASVPT